MDEETLQDKFQHWANHFNVNWLQTVALAAQESGFDRLAESETGARGIMQILPSTYKSMNPRGNVDDLWDVDENIKWGTKYFSDFAHRYPLKLAYQLYYQGEGDYFGSKKYEEAARIHSEKCMNYYNRFQEKAELPGELQGKFPKSIASAFPGTGVGQRWTDQELINIAQAREQKTQRIPSIIEEIWYPAYIPFLWESKGGLKERQFAEPGAPTPAHDILDISQKPFRWLAEDQYKKEKGLLSDVMGGK